MSNDPVEIPVDEEKTAPILYTEKNKVAYISINTKMNALNIELAKLFVSFLKQAEENPKIHVIVIKSEGDRIFSAGFDLRMFSQGISMDFLNELLTFGGAISKTIFFCKKPVISQIQASAIGLGSIMALSSDFRFVANREDLFFQLPEVDINMFPATGPTAMAIRVLGAVHAQEMLLTGRKVYLKEFNQWGGVTEIVEPEELGKTVKKFAKNLAQKPPNLLHSIKSAINMMSYDQALKWFELEDKMAQYNVKVLGNLEHPPIDTFLADLWKEYTAGKSQ
ncbi:MAG: enoyl-CoA hydratase/isomerase family protein [Promethearchaeota archaeon]|nr:MAG: enoyl-CoA hydratase/isomerase family protein [Candidatus Lokiarchaeota archaeon]